MEFINNLKTEYATKTSTYETEKDKLEKKIARLEKKLKKLHRPHWTDDMVRPIIEEVARRTPDIIWRKKEKLNTYGMRCECPIFGDTPDGHTVGIMFTHGEDIPRFDTGNKKREDFIGNDWNGFNNISKPIESIDELVAMIRRQERSAIIHEKEKSNE